MVAVFSLLQEVSIAQVNTEAMRKGDLLQGLHTELNLDVGVIAGNSKLLLIKTTLRFDYLKGVAHTFLVSSFHQGRQGQDDSLFVNRGFIHLRRTRRFSDGFFVEGFLQKEFNDFIRLKDRNLAGCGLRMRWLRLESGDKGKPASRLYTGLGFMWEQERLKNAEDPLMNLVRSTNYIVFRWEPDARLLLQVTTYFQVDVKRPSDHRVLFNGGLTFSLTGKLSAALRLNARYDHEPPGNIENYDIDLTNGLVYMF